MLIQWYPGHMAKARRMLQENLKLIDVVVEVVDARAPAATRNPDFDALFQGKTRVILLNKSDLADPSLVKAWVQAYRAEGILAQDIVSTTNSGKKAAVALIEQAAAPRVAKMKERGVKKTVRVLIAGIPNVGKSTFINRIAGANRAEVGDKPGVTKGKQWIRLNKSVELLDTPGILWPKFEDQTVGLRLALIGSIKNEILNVDELAVELVKFLKAEYPGLLAQRYEVSEENDIIELISAVAVNRKCLSKGGEPDYSKAAALIIDDFRSGKLGHITLERPEEKLRRNILKNRR